MIKQSENFQGNNTPLCSLCERCELENIVSDPEWQCAHKDSYPLLKAKLFYRGSVLYSNTQPNPDCLYKYNTNQIIAIEIKSQPISNALDKQLMEKIRHCVRNTPKNLLLKMFLLQVSSRLNSHKSHYQLLGLCDDFFNTMGFKLYPSSNNEQINILCDRSRTTQLQFDVVKCQDLDRKFNSLL